MEPKTMVRFRKIKELAKNIFGTGYVWTGFEKNDDAGTDVRHNSDGSRALIKPWPGNGDINDSDQSHLRFEIQNNNWYDGKADGSIADFLFSICESH